MSLDQQHAVIIGGSSGIGRDTAMARRVFEVTDRGQCFAAKHSVASVNDGGRA